MYRYISFVFEKDLLLREMMVLKQCRKLRSSQFFVLTFPEVYKPCSQMNLHIFIFNVNVDFYVEEKKSTNRHE
jgi:hypothetical protein